MPASHGRVLRRRNKHRRRLRGAGAKCGSGVVAAMSQGWVDESGLVRWLGAEES